MDGRCVSLSQRPNAAAARNQLILNHLRIVRAIATEIRAKIPVHVDLDDLVHDGICGLLAAAKRYDGARKVPFAAYAKYRIRGSILDGLRRLDPASRDHRAQVKRGEAAVQDLSNRLGRYPTAAKVAAETGISPKHWSKACFTWTAQPITVSRDNGATGLAVELRADEAFETDALAARGELRDALERAMQSLPRRDRQIIRLYHWRGCTMREIGRHFNINESRVSQIHKRALGRLAVTLRSSGITSSNSILLR